MVRSVSIHDDSVTPSPAPASRAGFDQVDGASDLPDDFDQIAIVVDWLDACRTRDLEALLDLYAPDASFECQCQGGVQLHESRTALEAYWRPRLNNPVPTAFGLEEITPTADGVALDYLDFDGTPARIFFRFTAEGKIRRSHCKPGAQTAEQDVSTVRNRSE
jgi:ketosteroid isomerase-like protein